MDLKNKRNKQHTNLFTDHTQQQEDSNMDLKNTQSTQNKQHTKKSKKHFLHDHFFREVYSQPKYCVDILSLVLSKQEMSLFDWNTLKTEATTFIDQSARERRMDLLVSALLKDSKKPAKILFLMEHKSQKDPGLDNASYFVYFKAYMELL